MVLPLKNVSSNKRGSVQFPLVDVFSDTGLVGLPGYLLGAAKYGGGFVEGEGSIQLYPGELFAVKKFNKNK
jgi:hypothetical protein